LPEAASDTALESEDDINGASLSQDDEAALLAQVVFQEELETQAYGAPLDTQAYTDPYHDLPDLETENEHVDDDVDDGVDSMDDDKVQETLARLSASATSSIGGSNRDLVDYFDLEAQVPESEEALINYTEQLAHQMVLKEQEETKIPEEELSKKQLEMKRYVEGKIQWNSRGGLGQQFRLEEGLKPEWKACVTPEEIERYRKAWTQKTLDTQVNEKVYSKSFKRVDTTKGKYVAPEIVVEKEGGWHRPRAVRAGQLHVQKCFLMGRPWAKWNSMTEMIGVLFLNKMWLH